MSVTATVALCWELDNFCFYYFATLVLFTVSKKSASLQLSQRVQINLLVFINVIILSERPVVGLFINRKYVNDVDDNQNVVTIMSICTHSKF